MAHRGVPSGPGWVAVEDLLDARLDRTLSDVAEVRGATSPAVAAVLWLDGYAQRLVAPVLAALHLEDRILDARPASVRVEPRPGGIRGIAFAGDPRPRAGRSETEARRLVRRGLIDEHLEAVVDVLQRRTRAGRRVLRGTLANAVATTFLHLSWPGPDRARFVGAARRLLDDAHLGGLATVAAADEAGEPWMYTDRRTCCLAFRTSVNQAREQPYCATCPVLSDATTRALFSAATASYLSRVSDPSHPAGDRRP